MDWSWSDGDQHRGDLGWTKLAATDPDGPDDPFGAAALPTGVNTCTVFVATSFQQGS